MADDKIFETFSDSLADEVLLTNIINCSGGLVHDKPWRISPSSSGLHDPRPRILLRSFKLFFSPGNNKTIAAKEWADLVRQKAARMG
ncbi:hypothetical protein H6P81_020633 [Aristolochia fimbriata]|uniref:Uncharacterized protein n=1 Tax=Aristolochia fimbriata TaxID=158543 RepID=A0AAV7DV48_ARIFI|nr:hypothetical protein H6P81_020633 [Aristolochia fimbriata]